MDCLVAAPSLVPKGPGDKVKTDKRDAVKLPRLLRSGDARGIHILDERDEAVRDVCRARTFSVEDLRRLRHAPGDLSPPASGAPPAREAEAGSMTEVPKA